MTLRLRAWHRPWGDTSGLAWKLAASLFGLITLPLMAYFAVSLRTSERAILASASQHSLEMLRDQRDYLALQLDQVHTLASNLGQIEEVNETLSAFNLAPRRAAGMTLETNARLGRILSSYRNIGSLVSIDVFALDGTCFHFGDSPVPIRNQSLQQHRFWERTVRSTEPLTWHGIEDNPQRDATSPKVIVATRMLWDLNSSWLRPEPVGMLMISYSANFFFEHFGRVNFGRNAYLLVLDDQKRLIYHPDPAKLGSRIAGDFSALLQKDSDSFLQRIGKDEVLLSYEHIPDKNWYIVGIVPKSTLLAPMGPIRLVGWTMLLASLALIVLGVRAFMVKVVLPIGAISDGFRDFQTGRIEPGWRMREAGMRQIAELVRWFNAFLEGDAERRHAEAEIRSLNADLERRVESRTRDLVAANEQLQQATELARTANRTKSQFLANMSHELRTPLNAILGFSRILRRNAELGDRERDFLDRILRSGEHLLGLINEVLSISKIESGAITLAPAPFELPVLLREIGDLISIRAEEKGLELRLEVQVPPPGAFLGDERKLRQVLINLLGNAVKFTERGAIGLRVEPRGDRFRFTVWDTGPGLSPEELAGLFTAFQQAEAGQRASEGTGLGLYISQAIVRLMGGNISVESSPGQGARFAFEIRLESAVGPGGNPAEALPVAGLAEDCRGVRTLVVDDRADNRDLLTELLTQWGFEVRSAVDGASALEAWEAWAPRIVWMDLVMPGMGGVEAMARIRAREAEAERERCLVIALSASALDTDRAALVAQGFDEFVLKPFREAELREPLERLAGLRFRSLLPGGPDRSLAQTAADLRSLPEAWRESFRRALQLGDLDRTLDLVAEVGDEALVRELKGMLRGYRFEELLDLLHDDGGSR